MKNTVKLSSYTFLIILITFILAEICAYFAFPFFFANSFFLDEVRQEILIDQTADSAQKSKTPYKLPSFVENKVLHPYLGFVYTPPESNPDWANFYGFEQNQTISKRSPEKLIIAISGGSFAQGLFKDSANILISALREQPAFKDKAIEVVNLSMGGYKQPQQLMALNYFLALGAEFDIWVNLDGFNELTLPYIENYQNGVSLAYPRLWKLYAQKSFSRQTLDLMTEINQVRNSRRKTKSFFRGLSKSSLFLVTWKKIDLQKAQREYRLNEELNQSLSGQQPSYQSNGPAKRFTNDFMAVKESVQIWQNSSWQMHNICTANNIKYLHLLQPNQYVKESKPMGIKETNIAFEFGPFLFKEVAQLGYPLLISAGKILKDKKVNFYDLTMIFKDEKRVIYADKLCHINKLGNDIIAGKISDLILKEYDLP